ncbi:DUF4115 domain-containing protein [Comamonadaceae bacterium G21597-S1]|nr:DUF4115 domain-containing protein [Comamonadaceae bacterium G21597-S1]
MNEPVLDAPQQAMLDAAAGKSAGTLLREAREAAGLHVGALAVSLKVPVKKLEALEADDLEQLPDAVFARALAATVCRSLKVDPEPVLARLPQLHTPPLQVGSQETPVRLDSRGGGMRMPSFGGLPRSVVYLSALLVIGAIAVSLLPSLQLTGDPTVADAPDAVAIRTVPNLVTQVPIEPLAQAASDTVATTNMTAITTATAVAPAAAASAPADTASAAAPQAAASQAAPAGAAAANADAKVAPAATGGGAIAVFTTREASWVQVVDAAGLVHLRKTMGGGETVSINGTLPLSVVIGRANAIDVMVRGKPFDVQAVAKDNVARFQIK